MYKHSDRSGILGTKPDHAEVRYEALLSAQGYSALNA
jgi:hypothetical protein